MLTTMHSRIMPLTPILHHPSNLNIEAYQHQQQQHQHYQHQHQPSLSKPRPLNAGDDMEHINIQPTINVLILQEPYTYAILSISRAACIYHSSIVTGICVIIQRLDTQASYPHTSSCTVSPCLDPMSQHPHAHALNPLSYRPSPVAPPLAAPLHWIHILAAAHTRTGHLLTPQTAVATANALATQSVAHLPPSHLQSASHGQSGVASAPPHLAHAHAAVSPGMVAAGNESLHAVAHLIRDNNNVVVVFLPSSFNQDALHQLCSAFGEILSCRLIRDRILAYRWDMGL